MILAILGALALASCSSIDPEVFDERLRRETFDLYVDEIDLRFGGWGSAGVDPEALIERHREAALSADEPEAFYDVLERMLLDLHDPHAQLGASIHHGTSRPSRPDRVRVARFGGRWYMGFPSGRRGPLDPLAFDVEVDLGNRLRSTRDASSMEWAPLLELDGYPVRRARAAAVLLVGPLLSTLRATLESENGESEDITLVRNASVVEFGPVRVLLGPVELASVLDPDSRPIARAQGVADPEPRVAIAQGAPGWPPQEARWIHGRRFEIPDAIESELPLGWRPRLEIVRSGNLAYLRVESFSLPKDPERRAKGLVAFEASLAFAFERFRGCRSLVLDLQGNGGGDAYCAVMLMSHLLPSHEVVPYRIIETSKAFLGLGTIRLTQIPERTTAATSEFANIAVLVDQRTGSAAEVVASALRGRCGARLVGERTIGAEFPVHRVEGPDGSWIQFGLDGGMVGGCESFQSVGLVPDRVVELELADARRFGLEFARDARRIRILRRGLEQCGASPDQHLHFDPPPMSESR